MFRLRRSRFTPIALAICSLGLSLTTVMPSYVLAAASASPHTIKSYAGLATNENSPPSESLAVSPNEQFQFVNTAGFEIINRYGKVTTGTDQSLVGATTNVFLSDPQTMWDPSTNRFYFSIFENRGTTSPNEGLVWGFSKTAKPVNASDFCAYFNNFNYGATSFPDRESLGDSHDFLLIGSNRYSADANESYLGSDLAWISKPPAGNTCPSETSFKTGIQTLHNADGTFPYTPTPAKQVDSDPTGWVAAVPVYTTNITQKSLTMFKVTKNSTTGAALVSGPQTLNVPTYNYPPYATQAGKMKNGQPALPLQTRIYLTQMIEAYDPRVGHDALWTDHTVAGGAGDAVQWFEINPFSNSLDQTGIISSPTLNIYNATLSPDRVVRNTTSAFGSSAYMTVNTSSSTAYTAIQMLSLVNGQAPSPLTMVKQSTGPYSDFTCAQSTYCRWGDYSGSVPDAGAVINGQTHGKVWMTNQWNLPDIDDSTPTWQTSIWQAGY